MKNGWVTESNTVYHEGDGISSTQIKQLCKTPRHFDREVVKIDPEVARIGTLVHTAILEPDELDKKSICPPSGNRATKEVKLKYLEHWEEMEAKGFLALPLEEVKKLKVHEYPTAYNDKCIPISRDDKMMCSRIIETIGEYSSYQKLLEGDKEVSGYQDIEWQGKEITCKIRPDVRNKEKGYILDVKTISDINMFQSSFFKLCYHISASWYLDFANILDNNVYDTFYFLVIEKKEPYSVMMFRTSIYDTLIEMGRSSYEMALDRYVECSNSGKWPGYDEEIKDVEVPKYLIQNSV